MRHLLLFMFLIFLASCQNAKSHQMAGLWKLHSMQKMNQDGSWSDFKGGMQGNLLYDGEKYMSLHLATMSFEKIDFDYPNFSDSISTRALKHMTNTYYYMGEYALDFERGIVTHKRISHSNPKDWGMTVQRRFSFQGDTLVIVPVEEANRGLKLKWLKAN